MLQRGWCRLIDHVRLHAGVLFVTTPNGVDAQLASRRWKHDRTLWDTQWELRRYENVASTDDDLYWIVYRSARTAMNDQMLVLTFGNTPELLDTDIDVQDFQEDGQHLWRFRRDGASGFYWIVHNMTSKCTDERTMTIMER